ncbi:uncharacterized protein METZ01_LOCUS183884 [marine metagenome]|uniref:Uncharacterized protein n=1 Tax=marine metagenome TaxID=408172 RepID=A0A382CXX2_9ZZZZ
MFEIQQMGEQKVKIVGEKPTAN